MAPTFKNILTDGTTISSIYLWILFSAICSSATTWALPSSERQDDSLASSQFRLNHLKNSIDSNQEPVHQTYLMAEPSFIQLPFVNRLLSRYRDTKRSWQNLQSSWGKRDSGNVDGNIPANLYEIDENNNDDYAELLLLLSKVYGLDGTGRTDGEFNGDSNGGEDFIGVGEKRAWNKMNTAWGKRLAAARNNNGENTYQTSL